MPKILRVLLAIALAFVLIGALALFLLKDRLVAHGLDLARDALAQEGIQVDWKPSPARFTGATLAVRLDEVTVFQDDTRQAPSARLSGADVRLHWWSSLIARAPRIDLATGDATLEFHPPQEADSEKVSVTGLNVFAEIHPDRVEVSPSTGHFQGIGFEFSGSLALPAAEPKPFVEVVETVEVEESPRKEPTGLDLSPVFELAQALDYRKSGFSPSVVARLTGTIPEPKTSRFELAVETVSFPSRDRDLVVAADVWLLPDGNTEIRALTVTEGEGSASGTASIPPGGNALAIPGFRSTLDWVGILRDVPALDGALDAVRLSAAPVLEFSGSWSFADPKASQLDGTLRGLAGTWAPPVAPAASGTQDAPRRPPIPFTEGDADFTLAIGDLRVDPGSVRLAAGPVRFRFGTKLFETAPQPWTLSLTAEDVSLGALTAAFGDQPLDGRVQLSFEGGGGARPADLHGKGNLAIVTDEPMRIPVVGPLIDLLQGVVPSLAGARSDELHGSYVIEKGVLSTQDLAIRVSAAEVSASGTIDFASEATSFQANANLRGALGQLTAGVSQVLAIEGGGPFRDVKWRFKNLQNAQSIKDLLKGGLRLPGAAAPPTPSPDQAFDPPETVPGKAGEILRSVDRIGGMLRELREPDKPSVPPAPPAPPASPAP
jgi:hypothetical protein